MKFTSRYLVDINTLFDTRLSAVAIHDKSLIEKLNFDVYRRRISEVWVKKLGITDWNKVANNSDLRVLKAARPTSFLYELRRHVHLRRLEVLLSSPKDIPRVSVNVYPFVLSSEEMGEFMKMFKQCFENIDVDICSYSPEELTPEYLMSCWDHVYLYDWYKWIELNGKKLTAKTVGLGITRPAILWADVTPEILETLSKESKSPFEIASRELREILTLESVDASLFSLSPMCDEEFLRVVKEEV